VLEDVEGVTVIEVLETLKVLESVVASEEMLLTVVVSEMQLVTLVVSLLVWVGVSLVVS